MAPLPEPDDFELVRCLTRAEVAALLSVSTDTVDRMTRRGDLDVMLIQGMPRIPLTSLRAYVDRQQRRGSVAPIRLPTRRTTADSEPPVRQPGRGMAAPDPSARKEVTLAPGVK